MKASKKTEASKKHELKVEDPKSIWASIFNCSDNKDEKTCKKARFKWVY